MRVGFVSIHDPLDPAARSGVAFSAFSALQRQGHEVVDLYPLRRPRKWPTALRWLERPVHATVRRLRNILARISRPISYPLTLALVRRRSTRLQQLVDAASLDYLVCINCSSALYEFRTSLPVIYSTDGTAKQLEQSYGDWARRPKGFLRVWEECEKRALSVATFAALPSQRAMDSAIQDYGVPPEKVRLVPRGANVLPESPGSVQLRSLGARPIRFAVVASDPERKRVQFCIQIVEELCNRGVDAILEYVGPGFLPAQRSSLVHSLGPLRLGRAEDRVKHQDLLARAHFFLMPSLGELFGLSVAEAAHFACPGLVSDVGGLSTAVLDGETGRVFATDAGPGEYADFVQELLADPDEYARLAEGARRRADRELTWDAWAKTVNGLVKQELHG